ncbi:hypothetical protein BKA69DRAFT_1077197 [Paraphysoderma sedebokerense]|nr:hypothetical protein BKA69DRAFT_1077197 [Paraphysoderma sedebokerense]
MTSSSQSESQSNRGFRSQREVCHTHRDQYFKCISDNYGHESPTDDPKNLCTEFRELYEKSCPKSWVCTHLLSFTTGFDYSYSNLDD